MTYSELESYFKFAAPPGGLIVFQIPRDRLEAADRTIKQFINVLKARDIGVIVFDEDATVVLVPEARRVLGVATAGIPEGGSNA